MSTRAPSLRGLRHAPWIVIALGLLVRVAFILSKGNHTYFADSLEYEAVAIRFLHGQGPSPDLPRAPLFPAFMALGFLIGGTGNHVAVRLLQLLPGVGLVVLTGWLANRLAGRRAVLPALLFTAFSPTLVFTNGMQYPTTLYTFLLLAATVAVHELRERPGLAFGALLGAAAGLGWLTDHVVIAPLAAMGLWLLVSPTPHRARWAAALAAAAVVALVAVVPFTSRGGGDAVFMQKAQYVLNWARTAPTMRAERHVRLPADEPYRALGLRELAAQEARLLREQPAAYAHDVAFEFLHFFKPMPDRVQTQNRYNRPEVKVFGVVHFVPLLLLAIAGLLAGPAAWRSRVLLAAVVLATAGFYALFFTQTRYRVPVEPQFAVLAALGFVRFFPALAAWLAAEPAPAEAPARASRPAARVAAPNA